MEQARLPLKVFTVLAALAWADGRLDPREADAVRRAAADQGLTSEEMAVVEAALRTGARIGDVDFSDLSSAQRLFLYAVAAWVATLSWGVNDRERAMLDALAQRLALGPLEVRNMEDAIVTLMLKPQGLRPERFDFDGLRRAIADRLAILDAVTPPQGTKIGG